MNTYVIAVKREMRKTAPANWVDSVISVPGVSLCGDSNPLRIQVNATPEAIREVANKLGHYCHIEPIIEHYPLS